jgi:prepilin-type N-terminal cleavage/methylation domain-containing protein/prepilin-type processing-associated H-X9-DG protein
MRRIQPHRQGFTLIELLVVIAIIAILAAILFPVFAQAKEASKKAVAISNQKQIGLAFMMYVNDHDDVLPNLTWADSFVERNPTIPTGFGAFWNGSQAWPISLIPYHKNDTKNGNTNSFLISPNDQTKPNMTKPDFKVMLQAVNWPNWDQYTTDWKINSRVFPLSFCSNYALSYNWTEVAPGEWNSVWVGPRATTSIQSPANTVLVTEYGQGIAGSYQATVYSNYYCMLGYGGVDRWKSGRRYSEGRTFSFADGHAKFYKDPVKIENLTGNSGQLQTQIRESYAAINVFDIPDRNQR